jgi:hypothetical protein
VLNLKKKMSDGSGYLIAYFQAFLSICLFLITKVSDRVRCPTSVKAGLLISGFFRDSEEAVVIATLIDSIVKFYFWIGYSPDG